ncbi:MAG: ATP-dependent RecD-like DNA helicase [Deltaproteobacteria bacterium]|nr:ATP-dependent RecD-like DNA helicase [Deltaproteobacteria bacterium]
MRTQQQRRKSSEVILNNEEETVEGEIERIVFGREDTSFQVVSVSTANGLITAVGDLAGVRVGERVRLHGRSVVDRRFGPQLKVRTFVPIPPSTSSGIEKYLASRRIKGLGPALAKRIVERFGESALDVIDKHPERLSEVPGLGKKKRKVLLENWASDRDQREALVFLQAHGLSAGLAQRVFKAYGPRTAGIVRESPYRLAIEVSGIGFRTADALGQQVGIPRDGPERAKAGLLFILGELADSGNVYAPREILVERTAKNLAIPSTVLESALDELTTEGRLILEPDSDAPVYLPTLHGAEAHAAARLLAMIAAKSPAARARDPAAEIARFETARSLTLAELQKRAVALALTEKVLVITGGPGTGKTTIIRAILAILPSREKVALTAPTGRAAKRMNEATGREAKTIHRLLEFDPVSAVFRRDASNPIEADVLIVDETSMVDIGLLSHLLDALSSSTRLIFVGDADQLPSVGAGAVLADLIQSGVIPVVRLEEVFRQAGASQIVENAHRVRRGQFPRTENDGDFYFFERDSPEDILRTVESLVATRIPRGFGLDPVDDVQVLTPMNRGPLGTVSLNSRLQALLNPVGPSVDRGDRKFRLGDKVMQVRNNYDFEVFNGDVGRIVEVGSKDGEVSVRFDERKVVYEADMLDQLVTAYACTIHKSQGSEFPAVVIPLHGQHYVLLKRNLIYTAITRAKKLVIVVGSRSALELAIRTNDANRRFSRLWSRLAAKTG